MLAFVAPAAMFLALLSVPAGLHAAAAAAAALREKIMSRRTNCNLSVVLYFFFTTGGALSVFKIRGRAKNVIRRSHLSSPLAPALCYHGV